MLRLSYTYVFFKVCVVKKCMGRDDAHPARVGDQKLVLNQLVPFTKVNTKTNYFHEATEPVLLK